MLSRMLAHSMQSSEKLENLLKRIGEDESDLVWQRLFTASLYELVDYDFGDAIFEEMCLVYAALLVECARRSFVQRDPEYAERLLGLAQESRVYWKKERDG